MCEQGLWVVPKDVQPVYRKQELEKLQCKHTPTGKHPLGMGWGVHSQLMQHCNASKSLLSHLKYYWYLSAQQQETAAGAAGDWKRLCTEEASKTLPALKKTLVSCFKPTPSAYQPAAPAPGCLLDPCCCC